MRLIKFGFDFVLFLTILFLFSTTLYFLSEMIHQGIYTQERALSVSFWFGLIGFFLALLLIGFTFYGSKRKRLTVRFKNKPISIDETIILDYVLKELQTLGYAQTGVQLDIVNGTDLHFHIQQEQIPSATFLKLLEEKLGELLRKKMGYTKDFQIFFSVKA